MAKWRSVETPEECYSSFPAWVVFLGMAATVTTLICRVDLQAARPSVRVFYLSESPQWSQKTPLAADAVISKHTFSVARPQTAWETRAAGDSDIGQSGTAVTSPRSARTSRVKRPLAPLHPLASQSAD